MLREMVPAAMTAALQPDRPTPAGAFPAEVTLSSPVEQGTIDGRRTRFVRITGGRVFNPWLPGGVLPGGGRQAIGPNGAAIDVADAGVRTSPRVTVCRVRTDGCAEPCSSRACRIGR